GVFALVRVRRGRRTGRLRLRGYAAVGSGLAADRLADGLSLLVALAGARIHVVPAELALGGQPVVRAAADRKVRGVVRTSSRPGDAVIELQPGARVAAPAALVAEGASLAVAFEHL